MKIMQMAVWESPTHVAETSLEFMPNTYSGYLSRQDQ